MGPRVGPARSRRVPPPPDLGPHAIINRAMATETTTGIADSLARVFPLGSRIDERGRLEVGGCDTIELAREFGTPAYVVAEDDLRARARAFVEAARAACAEAGETADPGRS